MAESGIARHLARLGASPSEKRLCPAGSPLVRCTAETLWETTCRWGACASWHTQCRGSPKTCQRRRVGRRDYPITLQGIVFGNLVSKNACLKSNTWKVQCKIEQISLNKLESKKRLLS